MPGLWVFSKKRSQRTETQEWKQEHMSENSDTTWRVAENGVPARCSILFSYTHNTLIDASSTD